jgi:hypothetical protein
MGAFYAINTVTKNCLTAETFLMEEEYKKRL